MCAHTNTLASALARSKHIETQQDGRQGCCHSPRVSGATSRCRPSQGRALHARWKHRTSSSAQRHCVSSTSLRFHRRLVAAPAGCACRRGRTAGRESGVRFREWHLMALRLLCTRPSGPGGSPGARRPAPPPSLRLHSSRQRTTRAVHAARDARRAGRPCVQTAHKGLPADINSLLTHRLAAPRRQSRQRSAWAPTCCSLGNRLIKWSFEGSLRLVSHNIFFSNGRERAKGRQTWPRPRPP